MEDKCGIIGIVSEGEDVLPLLFEGLFALQHRGQEACGFAAIGEGGWFQFKGLGLVHEVFEKAKERGEVKPAFMGIAHTRYSTYGDKVKSENIQPLVTFFKGRNIAIAHNGNISNADELREKLEGEGSLFYSDSDTEVLLYLYARSGGFGGKDPFEGVLGAYSLLIMDGERLIALRDKRGFRPLVMGRRGKSYIFASETAALDALGATFEREVEPGEVVILERGNPPKSLKFESKPAYCVFELIYFSRPDSVVFGEGVYSFRKRTGEKLAEKESFNVDVVVPIPDSGFAAAIGYSKRLGVPLELGLIRSHYIGRSFIQPDRRKRSESVRRKLLPLRDVLEGKRIALVDDSIVRGTTARAIVRLVRDFGAKEVHYRVASPPLLRPCFFGIDMPTVEEFIASTRSLSEIEEFLGVDSLIYLSLKELQTVLGDRAGEFCYACFSGKYPEGSLPERLKKRVNSWKIPEILEEVTLR
jgi:amidophosphoribosyltransferase